MLDYLIVGAGLFGSTFAHQAKKQGKKCLVIDQRSHVGGNCYTENVNGIEVHRYGAHIFHTSNETVWAFINQFADFNHFINQPVAYVDGETFNMPFNMNMFSKVFGITRPQEAMDFIRTETLAYKDLEPKNLEEQAIKLVGTTIYQKFIKGYSEKQWNKDCKELPPEFIKRLPVRFTYDNNYFDDTYQGIPKKGYTRLIELMLLGTEVKLNTPYRPGQFKAKKIIYTGMIDEFFDYRYGSPEYRSLKFIDIEKSVSNYQGCAVINYPSKEVPYTRSIEHKHFNYTNTPNTIISYEFPIDYRPKSQDIPYYPVGNSRNKTIYEKYLKLTREIPDVVFAGRLGSYQYNDMDDTIENALNLSSELQQKNNYGKS